MKISGRGCTSSLPDLMDDAALSKRGLASLRSFLRLMGESSPGARVIEMGDVQASVVPATPDRSVCNSVVYDRHQSISVAHERLATVYEDAGVRAWTVWVPERDAKTAALLRSAGHELDATPAEMALELASFRTAPHDSTEIRPSTDIGLVGRMNDEAYGYESDFARALERLPEGALRLHLANADGVPSACAAACDTDRDCGIFLVATLPSARGRGLATALMTHALVDARERGCTTSTLQATRLGEPIYERLGYRPLGRLQMWERRTSH